MNALRLLVGAALLVLGRKLFWLFVGAVGFAAGWAVAGEQLNVQPEWLAVVIALVVGVLGALVAQFVQRVAIGLAGFLAGAFLGLGVVRLLDLQAGWWGWLGLVVGGVLGVILMAAAFEWALIGLSSLAGAMLIAGGLDLRPTMHILVLIGLFLVGVVIQAVLRGGKRPAST